MKKEDIIIKLREHKLFRGIDTALLSRCIESNETEFGDFKLGETVFSPESKEKRLGFILCGEASVYSADGNRSVMLRSLGEGDTFGVSNLFDEKSDFVSLIIAKRNTSVLFFTPAAIGNLLDFSEKFRMSYINFLSERIRFLNKKISCFTAGSPERRLAVFLCAQSSEKSFSVSINSNSLSEMLNVGRASLYRAFDKLTDDGFIIKSGKSIKVLDSSALQKYYIN